MNKKYWQITIFLTSVLLSTVVINTLPSKKHLDPIDLNQNNPQYKFQKSLTFLKEENEKLEQELSQLKDQILKQEKSLLLQEDISNSLNSLRKKLGVSKLTGAGIIINLDDSKKINRQELSPNDDSLIHASDLRDILNLLYIANAQWVSINNNRTTFNTAISCVGNSILVWNKHIVPPIKIKVIGNSSLIKSYLQNDKLLENLYSRVNKNNLSFQIKEKKEITLSSFNYDYLAKYMTPGNWDDTLNNSNRIKNQSIK